MSEIFHRVADRNAVDTPEQRISAGRQAIAANHNSAESQVVTKINAPGRQTPQYSGLASSTLRYLLRTEVHTFAFSVAANAILSFFPFVVLLMTLIRRVFHSKTMYDVVVDLLHDYLPTGQDFVIRNLNAMVDARQRVQIASVLILLVTSTGIFLPLEVALNRIWGFRNNRSYLGNQLVSLGLAFGCGVLAMLSIALTAGNIHLLTSFLGGHANFILRLGGFLVMKSIRHRHEHHDLLPYLLGAAQWQSASTRSTAPRRDHGIALRVAEVRLYMGAAPAEFPGSLRTVCPLGHSDVLGIPLRIAVAHRSAALSPGTSQKSAVG